MPEPKEAVMKKGWIAAVAGSAVLAVAIGVSTQGAAVEAGMRIGVPEPGSFDDPRPNPYFPLEPGWKATLRGSADGKRIVETIEVTGRTKEIGGITTTVILDVVRHRGTLVEKTHDWYAADDQGAVWYFGERTATYDDTGDVVSTEGSWEAGVDGAIAGIIMPAAPRPTQAFREEFYRGHAEDQGWIVQRGGSVTVAYGTVDRVVRMFEWSRLEPGVMIAKQLAPGLGIVRETVIAGGHETLELVDVTTGR